MQPKDDPAAGLTPQTPESLGATKEDIAIMEPGEEVMTVIYKHPIGIVAIYAQIILAIVALGAVAFLVGGGSLAEGSSDGFFLASSIAVFVSIFLIAVLFIATYIYRRSKIIVTDKSLMQIVQRALFNRKVSRLSLSNVEDVSVEQKGILATVFNFGTLIVQTAGEMENFIFPLCPTPNSYADQIIEARQKYVKIHSAGKD